MSEFWKSNERHYCKICNCWMAASPNAIRTHEQGKGHQEAYIKAQKESRQAKQAAASKEANDAATWAKIEEAAKKSYEQDIARSGGAPASSSASASTFASSQPKYSPPPSSRPTGAASKPFSSSSSYTHAASSASAKPSNERVSPWIATLDPSSGATYYYNITTLETRWTLPEEEIAAKEKDEKKKEKQEQKQTRKRELEKAGDDQKEQEEDGNEENAESAKKKQKTGDSSSTEDSAAAAAPIEVDEDTGFGKWSTCPETETASAEEEQEKAATANRPRITPFGVVMPEKSSTVASSPSTSSSAAPSSSSTNVVTPLTGVASRYANFSADDSADADEDDEMPVDVAQQLRAQFGSSALIHAPSAKSYAPGTDLLQEETKQEPITVSFKKKGNRSNRKPTVATNNIE